MVLLIIWIFFGICAVKVASDKGRSGFGWILLGVLLGPFGLIIALLLPAIKQEATSVIIRDFSPTPHIMVPIDVSEQILLRKRLGRAALSLKIIGPFYFLLVIIFFRLDKYLAGSLTEVTAFWLGLSLSIVVFFGILAVSKKMRSGNGLAIIITGLLLLFYCIFVFFDAFPKELRSGKSDIISITGNIMFLFPIYFILRGLITFYSYNKRHTDGRTEKMSWVFGNYTKMHPAFVNKSSLKLYFFLMLTPLPLLYLIYHRFIVLEKSTPRSLGDAIGQDIGYVFTMFFMFFLSGSLYRRARRHALLPAQELRKKEHRPIVLFLRSFVDDQLKIRARAANGRSWLERFVKVTFEEVLVDHLWRYGPVVALGKPGDKFPPLGAARDYLPEESWQQKIEQLMTEADIIVVVLGRTEGLAWEITKLTELGLLSNLIFVLPPISEATLRIRWNYLCDVFDKNKEEKGGIKLPHDADLRRLRAIIYPGTDKIVGITAEKRDDWTYETVIDACVELNKTGHA